MATHGASAPIIDNLTQAEFVLQLFNPVAFVTYSLYIFAALCGATTYLFSRKQDQYCRGPPRRC